MTLKFLFQKRYSLYVKQLLKYAKHIVNDHFILVLFLLLGVGGYTYSLYLDTLTNGMVEPRILVGLLFFVLTSSGAITLLLEPADRIFLLPKEQEFKQILKNLTVRSWLEQFVSTAVVTFITFPIFVATVDASPTDGVLIFLTMASLKGLNLLVKMLPFYGADSSTVRTSRLLFHGLKVLVIGSLLFLSIPITAMVTVLLGMFGSYLFLAEKNIFSSFIRWEAMIEAEELRLQRIYRFIQMFMNVPQQETKIRRLAFLDPLLDWYSNRYQEAPYYYGLRNVIRNQEYSNLILRLTLVGALLLAVTESFALNILLTVLFLYMIGFQMIALVDDIERLPQFQFYPVSEKIIFESVFRIIFEMLSFATILLTAGALNSLGFVGFSMVPIGISFAYLFSYFYAPERLKTMKN